MSDRKVIALDVAGRTVSVVMQRHHWSRQVRLSVRAGGQVKLSVPLRTPWYFAESFLARSKPWLEKHLAGIPTGDKRQPTRSEREQARRLVKAKLNQWSMYFDVQWGSVRIGNQSSRWGSCSSSGTLSFNWRLIELPDELTDYIVVHELAHLVHQNHSPRFWAEVERVLPHWRAHRKSLRAHSTSGITEG